MQNKLLLCIFLLLIACFLIAQMQEKEKVINVGIESDLNLTNPWTSGFAVDGKILWNVLQPLVSLEEGSTRLKPYLATSWKTSDNNRTWLIKLRQGVKFHNGNILKADDVVASVSLFQEFNAKVEKADDFTVRFILPEPNSGFIYKLALVKCAIAPVDNIDLFRKLQDEGNVEEFIPIGSGPFKFSRWDRRNEIILESFSDYWQGTPWLEKLVYRNIPDNKERISALEKGEVDLIDILFPEDLVRIRRNSHLEIKSTFGMNICYIAINTMRQPLNDMKIRQALNLAVDKMQLTQKFFYGGYGTPTSRILSPAFWGFGALPNAGSYNAAQAKELLTEAGFDKDKILLFLIPPIPRPYVPDPRGLSEDIKKQLALIGVNVQIVKPVDWDEFGSILSEGTFDLALSGWIDMSGDPDYTLSFLLSGEESNPYNLARWHSKLFDEKLQKAREFPLSNVSGKIQLYNEAQKIFQQEAPWIPLTHTKIFIIHHRKVKGLIFYPSSIISYHKVRF
jgi:peptide/nickel transport system substrate-binding protein